MSKNISSANTYLHQPCGRCGSKRRISKKWKERVPTLTGTTVIEYSQIICTNKICQVTFDKQMQEEKNKREVIRIKKEENMLLKKANYSLQAKNAKKKNSRI